MRLANRIIATALGLGLATAGVTLVVETTLALLERPAWLVPRRQWARFLSQATWQDAPVVAALAVTTAVGVSLVVAQLVPRRPATMPLRGDGQLRRSRLDRRSLEQRLQRAVERDGDVASARVRVGRRRARVDVAVLPGAQGRQVRERLRDTLGAAMDELGLARSPRPTVTVRGSARRVA